MAEQPRGYRHVTTLAMVSSPSDDLSGVGAQQGYRRRRLPGNRLGVPNLDDVV
jgi:hypothetical protein